ncbi:PAS domain S-box protein [Halalkalibaculum sp. DA3122]|uniref:PAS domain S-box protein n=1 Tax=unclassified Halalkalibaculum TaxID=2964617 RepID=UPI0037553F8D
MALGYATKERLVLKCSINLDGTWRANPIALGNRLGYSSRELQDRVLADLFHPDDKKEIIQALDELRKGKKREFDLEKRMIAKSGRPVSIYLSGALIRDEEGMPEYLFCFIRELTGGKSTEKRLEEVEQRFSSLFRHNPQPAYYFDLEGNFRGFNKRMLEFTGYSRSELRSMNFQSLIVEEDLSDNRRQFEKAVSGKPSQDEIRVVVNGGERREIRVTKFPMFVDGEVQGVFGVLEDITGRKDTFRELERSKQRFKSLFERNPYAVFSFDLQGNIVRANRALVELTGYTAGELQEIGFKPLVVARDRDRAARKFREATRGTPQTFEVQVTDKGGQKLDLKITNLPIYVDGEIVGVFGIAQDITREKEAQRRLQESEERWQRLVEENPQPVQIIQDGKIKFINRAGLQLYGASEIEELIGKKLVTFCHPDYRDLFEQRKERLENNCRIDAGELVMVRLDGEERVVETHSIPITFRREDAIQTVLHDITERKHQEEVIKESLTEKKVLLQEIHHRVKNNLAVISGLLELQAMNTDDEATLATLRESQMRIQSMAMIHQKLYQSEALSGIGFDRYVKELIQTIENTYHSEGQNVSVKFEMDSVQLNINQAIPSALILNELVSNVFKHAFKGRDGGTVWIHIGEHSGRVQMKVVDNGVGIGPDFDIQKQHSLGMTLVNTLTQQLEGDLEVRSVPDVEGTEIAVSFDFE